MIFNKSRWAYYHQPYTNMLDDRITDDSSWYRQFARAVGLSYTPDGYGNLPGLANFDFAYSKSDGSVHVIRKVTAFDKRLTDGGRPNPEETD